MGPATPSHPLSVAFNTPATARLIEPVQEAFVDYYRCPISMARLAVAPDLAATAGYFEFAGERCFGRPANARPARDVTDSLTDVAASVQYTTCGAVLPFDLAEVVTNLREERYGRNGDSPLARVTSGDAVESLYYSLRPILPVRVRKHLQQLRLRGWEQIPFPRWPVDATVDELMRHTMAEVMKAGGLEQLPFVWFWPEGAPNCTMLTHDVEGEAGLAFCSDLIDLDERFGMTSSFQLIPEGAANAWRHADRIRGRGCEVNLHDLNHDGRLYRDKATFLARARRINEYARQAGCAGFRSGAMYREQAWYDAFDFAYDMSVPNTAHLEPQRGGCCTVMPYFVGKVLELPLTTVQDYSLFFILGDYSIDLWREQIRIIQEQNGLVSIITHPDYLVGERERAVYTDLLTHIARMRDERQTWLALPGEINRWWRNRQAMTLTASGTAWRIEGPDSGRARVAYARLDGDRVVYTVEPSA